MIRLFFGTYPASERGMVTGRSAPRRLAWTERMAMAKQTRDSQHDSKHDAQQDLEQNPKRAGGAASDDAPSNAQKDPDQWVTGDESMTGAQASYLKTLTEEAGEEFDPELTKAEASKRIDALREQTGRGIDH